MAIALSAMTLNSQAEVTNNVKDTPLNSAGVGQLAPDFVLTDMNQKTFKLSQYRGKKPVYLVFWNTWCPPCRKKVPALMEVQKNLSDELEILAINTSWDDSHNAIREFQQEFNSNYAIAWDDDARVTDLYAVWGTPTEFIIDIDGIIRHRDHIPQLLTSQIENWSHSRCGQSGVSC